MGLDLEFLRINISGRLFSNMCLLSLFLSRFRKGCDLGSWLLDFLPILPDGHVCEVVSLTLSP